MFNKHIFRKYSSVVTPHIFVYLFFFEAVNLWKSFFDILIKNYLDLKKGPNNKNNFSEILVDNLIPNILNTLNKNVIIINSKKYLIFIIYFFL